MIRFCCQHCGKAVCVSDAHAGARGRCPQCREIVTIPSSDDTERNDNVAALAAALQGQGDNSDSGIAPPPPPPQTHNTDTDEFKLVDIHTSSAFETDTYPAVRNEHDKSHDDGSGGASVRSIGETASARQPDEVRSRKGLIIAVILAAAVVVAGILLLYWCFT